MNSLPDERAVIGLEIHIELKSMTKLFCGCASQFGAAPNGYCCPVCTGQPGALPKLNRRAAELGMRLGLALGGEVQPELLFDRKCYFYPDLPKGYQITQRRRPVIRGGGLMISSGEGFRQIRIREAHIEEDAGKLIHDNENGISLIDFNRSGVPLLEVVTEPDLCSGEEAAEFARRLRDLAVWLGVSDGKMQEGSLRADVNVSLVRNGEFGERTEIKNIGSFRDIARAVDAECERQRQIYSTGRAPERCTLRWDADNQCVSVMRGKEGESDYRYFPEPDIPAVAVDAEYISQLKEALGELPFEKELRYRSLGVDAEKADLLTQNRDTAEFCDKVIACGAPPKDAVNWVLGDTAAIMRQRRISGKIPADSETLARLIVLVNEHKITRAAARDIFEKYFDGEERMPALDTLVLNPMMSDDEVSSAVERVIQHGGRALDDYRSGKKKAFGAIMGAVMRELKGQADPGAVSRILKERLDRE